MNRLIYTVVNNTPNLFGVVCRTFRCAVSGCNVEFTTSACFVVRWTVHFALSMAITSFYSPVMLFSILNSVFNFFCCLLVIGCQVTTELGVLFFYKLCKRFL